MVNLNIELPESFFQEEERDGYLVSAEVKKLWAVQLDLLNEFDRVCRKHGLKYVLDFGSLLGAVRHKGYIPWDDDLDVSMLRDDYDRLMEIGPKVFKEPYFLQSPITEKNYNDCVTKLRRSDTCLILNNIKDGEIKYNQGIFIDIFVYDHVPSFEDDIIESLSEESRESYYRMRVMSHKPRLCSRKTWSIKGLLSYMYNKMRYGSVRKEYLRLERKAKNCPKTGIVGTMMFMDTFCRPLSVYEKYIELPFENMMCPVPYRYDEVLRLLYGDYMTPIKDSSGHTMLLFDVDRSYKEVIKDKDLLNNCRERD